jgi:hypothetical protein
MGLDVDVSHVLPMLARDVANAQQGSFSVSDYRVRRNVAVDVHEMQSAIGVEIALSDYTERLLAVEQILESHKTL